MAKTLGKAIIPIKNGGDVGLIGNFKDSVSFLYYPSLDKNDALYKERYKYWKSELDKAVLSNDTYYIKRANDGIKDIQDENVLITLSPVLKKKTYGFENTKDDSYIIWVEVAGGGPSKYGTAQRNYVKKIIKSLAKRIKAEIYFT